MRELNKLQKEILKNWFKDNKENIGYNNIMEEIPCELFEFLESINDYETIYQDIENFIDDLISNEN